MDIIRKSKNAIADLKNYYELEGVLLGKGAFARVHLANSKGNKEEKYAVKQMNKSGLSVEMVQQIREEINILSILHCANIVKYVESFEDERLMLIVMEYCPGGQLLDEIFNTINKKGAYSENEAAKIIK